VTFSQLFGLAGALALIIVSREAAPVAAALAWGGAAGISGVVGLLGFYRALANGTMSLVAPVTSIIGAGIPALVGIVTGDVLSPLQVAGMACALAAVVIVSRGERHVDARSIDWPLVFLAGLGFAGFFIGIGRAHTLGGAMWWPLLAARLAPLALLIAGVVLLRRSIRVGATTLPLVGLSAFGDLGGNAFFLLAQSQGAFSVAVVLSSLYPVTTVLLAAVVLGERLKRGQAVGVLAALVGVALIAAGGAPPIT
jgi:drug/metabolite transporter (DMT)-like permease